jgi:two-component system OmpR family response regulator
MSRIILVGSDTAEMSGIQEVLKRYGHRVLRLSEGGPALEAMESGDGADAVIMDLDASGEDGLGFVSALRKTAPALPVVLLAGRGSMEEYLAARSLGADAYIVKPVNARNLERVVTAIVRGRRTAGDRQQFPSPAQALLLRDERG